MPIPNPAPGMGTEDIIRILGSVTRLLGGEAGWGNPVTATQLNDASAWAGQFQNLDPTQSRALLVLKSDGSVLIQADVSGVTLGGPIVINPGGLTVQTGDLTVTAGRVVMGAAASKLVPGATSFAIRSNNDTADNLLVTDAGVGTFRGGLVVTAGGAVVTAGDVAITAGRLTMGAAASKLVPGATSLSVRSNNDTADNLLISDAGLVTARAGLVATTGDVAVTAGRVTMGAAASKLVPGATSFSVRSDNDTLDNLLVTNAGAVTARASLTSPQLISTVATGTAPLVVASTTVVTNLNAALLDGNAAAAFLLKTGGTMTGTLTLNPGAGATALSVTSGNTFFNTTVLVVDGTNSRVGIGLNNPQKLLHVNGETRLDDTLFFSQGSAKIVPGATSLLIRNNADTVSNLVISDAGDLTIRGSLDHDGTLAGFYGATPVARPTYTLTGYAASRTLAAQTSATASSSYSGVPGALGDAATRVDLNDLRLKYNDAVADINVLGNVLRAIVADKKANGLFA